MRESYVFFIPSKSIVSERINRQGGRLAVQQQAGNRTDAEAVTGKAAGNRQSLYFFASVNDRNLVRAFIHHTAPRAHQLGVL
jgi:hypothetical protein